MNRPGCPCGPKDKSPRSSPYETHGYGQPSGPPQSASTTRSYGQPQESTIRFSPSGTGSRPAPVRRPPCGPQPCGRQTCPKSPKPAPIKTEVGQDNDEAPKGFEMNNATWSLCAAVMLFCCGVYLTKKMAIVANELG